MNKETREEYLENIYKLSLEREKEKVKTGEIADKMGLSPPTVTEVLPVLDEEGYIEYIPYYGVKLTEDGVNLGKNIVRTHRVLEVFLKRYFSLDQDQLHEKACQMEHIFDEEMIDEMCKRLGAPGRCPHGKKIPSCDFEECPVEGD
ncbi:MAG: metal-dependent transcriptional regulator [Candidatus Saliniplasma sp.]